MTEILEKYISQTQITPYWIMNLFLKKWQECAIKEKLFSRVKPSPFLSIANSAAAEAAFIFLRFISAVYMWENSSVILSFFNCTNYLFFSFLKPVLNLENTVFTSFSEEF